MSPPPHTTRDLVAAVAANPEDYGAFLSLVRTQVGDGIRVMSAEQKRTSARLAQVQAHLDKLTALQRALDSPDFEMELPARRSSRRPATVVEPFEPLPPDSDRVPPGEETLPPSAEPAQQAAPEPVVPNAPPLQVPPGQDFPPSPDAPPFAQAPIPMPAPAPAPVPPEGNPGEARLQAVEQKLDALLGAIEMLKDEVAATRKPAPKARTSPQPAPAPLPR